MKKETAVAIISILAVLAVVMCILFANVNGQNKSLTTDIESKKDEISQLSATIEGLKGDVASREAQIGDPVFPDIHAGSQSSAGETKKKKKRIFQISSIIPIP